MRPDMGKKLVESGGHKTEFPRGAKKFKKTGEEETSIKSIGMRKSHLIAGQGEYYGPDTEWNVLRRLLQHHRGKPWDQVYSEICQASDGRTFAGRNLREALEWMVVQNCTLSEGEISDAKGQPLTTSRIRQFFVHPETGLLEEIKHIRRLHWREELKQTVFELDGCLYHKHNGIWYRVMMSSIPLRMSTAGHRYHDFLRAAEEDAFLQSETKSSSSSRYCYSSDEWTIKRKYGKAWYCVEKQSASSKEINKLRKKYGVE